MNMINISKDEKKRLIELQEKLQVKFNDISLLKLALTHKSYAYEKGQDEKKIYNERIEFLGDAILEHVISDLLYKDDKMYSEGQMSKLRAAIVCEASLSKSLKRINGQEYIYLGKGERLSDGEKKDAIIADAFEAILGAIYLDLGYDVAKNTVLRLLDMEIKEVLSGENLNIDYKTKLQEFLQRNGTVRIEYVTVKEEGPDHMKTFTVEVKFEDKKIGEGIGKTKKQAQQNAAKQAYNRFVK